MIFVFTKKENWEFKKSKFIITEIGLTVLDGKAEVAVKIDWASAHEGRDYAALFNSPQFTQQPYIFLL